MVAAKYCALQIETGEKAVHFDEQFLLREGFPTRETGTQTILTLREAGDQCRQVLGLSGVDETRGVFGMLLPERAATETIENHHGAGNAGGAKFQQGVTGGLERFALADVPQYFVIAGFSADINNF